MVEVSPLFIFILLLLILVISMVIGPRYFSRDWRKEEREGMVGFMYSSKVGTKISIDEYNSSSSTVVKLYNNIYYDPLNGNIIEVFAPSYTGTIKDIIGITNLMVIPRGDTNAELYVITDEYRENPTDLSLLTNVPASTISYYYMNICKDASPSVLLLYIPNGLQDTLVIGMDVNTILENGTIDNNTFVSTTHSYYIDGKGNVSILNLSSSTVGPSFTSSSYVYFDDSKDTLNGTTVTIPSFPNDPLYQITTNVLIDISNQEIVIKKGDVYTNNKFTEPIPADMKGNNVVVLPIKNTPNTVVVLLFGYVNGYVIGSTTNTYGIKYVVFLDTVKNTVINNTSFIGKYPTIEWVKETIQINSSTNDEIDKLNASMTTTGTGTTPPPPPHQGIGNDLSGNAISEYYKWYWYWNTATSSPAMNSDYILKTEIVPPQCPNCSTCPNCSGKGACSYCGGNGGSGTLTNDGNSLFTTGYNNQQNQTSGNYGPNGAGGVANNVISTTGGIVNNTVGGAVDLTKDTVGNVVDLTKDTVGGAVDLGKDTVGGAVDLGKDVVGGTVDLVKDTVSGTVDLGKDIVGGTVDEINMLLTNNNNGYNGYNNGYGYNSSNNSGYGYNREQGTSNQYSNPFTNSYTNTTNRTMYLPVTADFSAFSR